MGTIAAPLLAAIVEASPGIARESHSEVYSQSFGTLSGLCAVEYYLMFRPSLFRNASIIFGRTIGRPTPDRIHTSFRQPEYFDAARRLDFTINHAMQFHATTRIGEYKRHVIKYRFVFKAAPQFFFLNAPPSTVMS